MQHTSLRLHHWMPLAGALVALPLLTGCPAKKDPPKKAETTKAAKKPAKAPPAKKPAGQTADPVCMAAWSTEGAPQTIEAAGRSFSRTGTKLTETSKDEDNKAVLGILANIKEDTPDNLKNVEAALAFFKSKSVDAIVVVGDLGETQSQIENGMKSVAATGLPVFTIIGNREKKSDYAAGLKSLSAAHNNVVDLNQVRLAQLDDVALVSVPGYYDKAYIHAEEGCQYFPADLTATKAIVKQASQPVVLVSHGPPKQEGSEAVDRTLEQANVGDANLSSFINEAGIKFGLFANIQEAGGRATDASGKTLIKPGTPSDVLFLNPGAIDAVSWEMNDGSRSVGMATVMTVDSGKASYEVFKISEPQE